MTIHGLDFDYCVYEWNLQLHNDCNYVYILENFICYSVLLSDRKAFRTSSLRMTFLILYKSTEVNEKY